MFRLLPRRLPKSRPHVLRAAYSSTSNPTPPAPTSTQPADVETVDPSLSMQAPNRSLPWSERQNPRKVAMTGPRFEQTDFALQPRPHAAIELIHQVPVKWVNTRVVACDGVGGTGGNTGHPRVYINVDKEEIVECGYCGLPYAHEHHRKHLESLPTTDYPLA